MQQLANWGGNHVYRAAALHRPATLAELREIVARARRVRALGSRHSFSDIGDSVELVALDGLAAGVVVVGLGALGIVTRVTLDVEPAYEVRQRVFEGLSWDALHEHFDEITASGYSVSVFTRWGETVDQVWIKSRVADAPEQEREQFFGAVAATVERHPILGLDAVNCTPQLGVTGLWSDRLPHFRIGFTPNS